MALAASTPGKGDLDSPRARGRWTVNLRLPPERRLDLLAVLADDRPMQTLLGQLRAHGFGVDIARDLGSARSLFFGSGGHHCLVVGPDVAPGLAGAIVESLREVDPELPMLTFATAPGRTVANSRTTAVGFHPGSRAGAVALLRFLRGLPERG
jgi:hypothetical protein